MPWTSWTDQRAIKIIRETFQTRPHPPFHVTFYSKQQLFLRLISFELWNEIIFLSLNDLLSVFSIFEDIRQESKMFAKRWSTFFRIGSSGEMIDFVLVPSGSVRMRTKRFFDDLEEADIAEIFGVTSSSEDSSSTSEALSLKTTAGSDFRFNAAPKDVVLACDGSRISSSYARASSPPKRANALFLDLSST